jgi:hypothetical protein
MRDPTPKSHHKTSTDSSGNSNSKASICKTESRNRVRGFGNAPLLLPFLSDAHS